MRDVKGLISYTSKQARKLKDLQLLLDGIFEEETTNAK